MKLMRLSFICSLIFIMSCSSLQLGNKGFKLRPFKKIQLSNGLKVTLIPDAKLPYFTLGLLIKSGDLSDPKSKEGVSSLVASLLDKGTKNKRALQLADELAQKGSRFSASSGADVTRVGASGLSLHREQLLAQFSERLLGSVFPTSELRRQKKQMLSGMKKIVDNPRGLNALAFSEFVYEGHIYGAPSLGGTSPSLKRIKRSDLVSFYKKHYNATNSDLFVVGDLGPNIESLLEKYLGGWGSGVKTLVKATPAVKPKARDILLVTKPDLKQSQVLIGHPSITRGHPDYLKLKVVSSILGEGFGSRLMTEIRVKRGLTYSVNSSFNAKKHGGYFVISTFSRNEKLGEIVAESLNVLDKFIKEGVTEKELNLAKALIKGGFPRIIETAESLANNIQLLEYYGVGVDYLRKYTSDVEKFTVKEINEAIRKHLSAQKIKITVLAPKKTAFEALKKIGSTKVKSYREYLR